MRKGGGKKKGGAFEHVIARKIAEAFKVMGVQEDDSYRTKNSGATKAQPGDLQLSPLFAKYLPATIECKHYKNIKYKLGRSIFSQPKSYEIKAWWQQVLKQETQTKNKFGLLIMRENNCIDMCMFSPSRLFQVFAALGMSDIGITRYTFRTIVVTMYKEEELWIVPLSDFLSKYVLHLKWFSLFDIEKLRKEFKHE